MDDIDDAVGMTAAHMRGIVQDEISKVLDRASRALPPLARPEFDELVYELHSWPSDVPSEGGGVPDLFGDDAYRDWCRAAYEEEEEKSRNSTSE